MLNIVCNEVDFFEFVSKVELFSDNLVCIGHPCADLMSNTPQRSLPTPRIPLDSLADGVVSRCADA